jgi:pimeloyl-ACP methyl ester carboxylesterase
VLTSFDHGTFFGERFASDDPTVSAQEPAILGLHGWGRSHTDLRSVLNGYDAIALDLPGFGASPPPATGWTTLQYAEALDPVIDEMKRPIVIVAHSFGGRVGVHVAARRPAAVAGLVLSGVPLLHRHGRRAKPKPAFRAGKLLNRLGILSDSRMESLRDKFGSDDYRNTTGIMREVFVSAVNESYEEVIGKVICPVELVWGDADTAAPAEIARRAEAMFADARLTVVGDVDHFLPITHPAPMREALQRRMEHLLR